MKAYELLFFVAPSVDEETQQGVMQRIEKTISESKGTIDNIDVWGKRKLAYEVNGLSEGNYTLVDFHADPQEIQELDRRLRISDTVVRHMIVARKDRN